MAGDDDQLGDLAGRLDAERFVGRADLVARAADAITGASPTRLVYVHGPAGVGKSAALRAIGREAGRAGRTVVRLDGRTLAATPAALGDALAPAAERPSVVLLDEVDELASVRFALRQAVVSLPAATVVVVAGRLAPERDWFDGPLATVTVAVGLRPLDDGEAREVLRRHGVTDTATVSRILPWAAGYPLALTVAATTGHTDTGSAAGPGPAEGPGADRALDTAILARLAGTELDEVDPDVLDVAGIAPLVDSRLLAAVLPGRPTRAGLRQLRETSVSETVGSRVALHRLVRSAVRTRLRDTDPERYRTLVVRVAEHLHHRAVTGEPQAALELLGLIEDPRARVGYGASTTHYVDRPRPADLDAAAVSLGVAETRWWARLVRWCADRPDHVLVVRRADGAAVAIAVTYRPSEIPAWALDEIEAGPVVAHLRETGIVDISYVAHEIHIFDETADEAERAEIYRVGNAGIVRSSGAYNPRHMVVTSPVVRTDDGSAPFDYGEVEALRRGDDERDLVTTIADFGPSGIYGGTYAMIRAEQLGADAGPAPDDRGAALLDALRSFHDDGVLATSPLGSGEGAARVASVRDEVRAAVAAAFTDSEADRLLRTALERTYLDGDGGHAVARGELYMSRSTFYRHLQRGRDRLTGPAAPSR